MRVVALALALALMPGGSMGPLGELTDLMVRRMRVGDLVAAAEFGTPRPIDDPVREQQVLEGVRARSMAMGLDPESAVRFFRAQIEANKAVQRGLYARWMRHPDEVPAERPDLLTDVRLWRVGYPGNRVLDHPASGGGRIRQVRGTPMPGWCRSVRSLCRPAFLCMPVDGLGLLQSFPARSPYTDVNEAGSAFRYSLQCRE
ncbi:chorismate mutase AroQ, gamma subclass [Spongiactinospora gelatinilytica]|uniref:chorismate mutase n=1 Tax=Spongiactinospora gelatinilytica TaxID=2666298 RepID=A0A2W2HNM6_9ACTN|nr:gamma subclass chorismate mutase AroQ [Spongiactinospora gelatinilytica]PZG53225.1 chorismate mutase AroQ, gamma subclass [Spongiactinospora gelatinilytica]